MAKKKPIEHHFVTVELRSGSTVYIPVGNAVQARKTLDDLRVELIDGAILVDGIVNLSDIINAEEPRPALIPAANIAVISPIIMYQQPE